MSELSSSRSSNKSRSRSRRSRDDRSKSSVDASATNDDSDNKHHHGSRSQSLSPDRPSNLFQGDDQLLTTTPSSSLFGEVMRSVKKESSSSSKRKTPSSNDLPDFPYPMPTIGQPATPQQEDASSFDIQTRENDMDPEAAVSNIHAGSYPNHGTPSQSTSALHKYSLQTPQAKTSKAAASLFSPGGFQMMKFINNAADSPLKTNLPDTAEDAPTPKKERPLVYSFPFPPQKRTSGDLVFPLLDWSLKDHVAIEWNPLHSSKAMGDVPLRHILMQPNSWIQQQACQRFTSGLQRQTSNTPQGLSQADLLKNWNESLLYWQYPATNPFAPDEANNRGPNYRNNNNNSQLLRFHGNTTASVSYLGGGASRFGDFAVRNRQTANKLRGWYEESRGHNSNLKEWRDSFWSLYSKWRLTVQELVSPSSGCHNSQTTLEDAAQTCFYVCGAGHSLLFRVKAEKSARHGNSEESWDEAFSSDESDREDDQDTEKWKFTPEIVLSSSSSDMRSRLRRMGVQCRFATAVGNVGTNFDSEEDFWKTLEEATLSTSSTANEEISSPSVAADLIALRREQAMGKTIGADITVKTQSKRSKKRPRRSPRRMPPIVISDDQDCAAFAEWYLNTAGNVFHDPSIVDDRKPILLCRHLGPFLHSTMKQVRVQKPTRSNKSHAIYLKGFILPCAIREILSSVISLSRNTEDQSSETDDGFLIQVKSRVHGGFETPLTEGAIGGPSTILFNNEDEKAEGGNQKRQITSCHCGEVATEISTNAGAMALVDIHLHREVVGFR